MFFQFAEKKYLFDLGDLLDSQSKLRFRGVCEYLYKEPSSFSRVNTESMSSEISLLHSVCMNNLNSVFLTILHDLNKRQSKKKTKALLKEIGFGHMIPPSPSNSSEYDENMMERVIYNIKNEYEVRPRQKNYFSRESDEEFPHNNGYETPSGWNKQKTSQKRSRNLNPTPPTRVKSNKKRQNYESPSESLCSECESELVENGRHRGCRHIRRSRNGSTHKTPQRGYRKHKRDSWDNNARSVGRFDDDGEYCKSCNERRKCKTEIKGKARDTEMDPDDPMGNLDKIGKRLDNLALNMKGKTEKESESYTETGDNEERRGTAFFGGESDFNLDAHPLSKSRETENMAGIPEEKEIELPLKRSMSVIPNEETAMVVPNNSIVTAEPVKPPIIRSQTSTLSPLGRPEIKKPLELEEEKLDPNSDEAIRSKILGGRAPSFTTHQSKMSVVPVDIENLQGYEDNLEDYFTSYDKNDLLSESEYFELEGKKLRLEYDR